MIEEAYVSFETAKLLKEKGFDVSCYGRYSVRSKEFHLDATKPCNNGGNSQYSAPTQQMAMRWLREVHNLSIDVSTYTSGFSACVWNMKRCRVVATEILIEQYGGVSFSLFCTYEEACEVAIKYCLENLI